MGRKYFGRNGKSYMLEDSPFANGGEGEVYNVIGDKNSVAKLYKAAKFKANKYVPDPKKHMEEKIETMLDQPINPNINGVLCVAYPTDILRDSNGEFVGYVMPRVHASKSIITGERVKKRETFFNKYTYRHSVVMAYNLAYLVSQLHKSGITLGDFNYQNYLLNTDGTISIVDADSFNIRNKKTGKVYKCNVGIPEMLPPELQGRELNNPKNEFNEYTDSFSLAIHIFVLLMNNQHPFTVVMPQNTSSSSSSSKLEKNITEGKCPYTTNSKWKNNTPPSAVDVMMLPEYIRSLFDRTFTYDVQNSMSDSVIRNRARADEWVVALRRMLSEIDSKNVYTVCSTDRAHLYRKSYGSCPFCHRISGFNQIPVNNITYQPPVSTKSVSPKAWYAAIGSAIAIVIFIICLASSNGNSHRQTAEVSEAGLYGDNETVTTESYENYTEEAYEYEESEEYDVYEESTVEEVVSDTSTDMQIFPNSSDEYLSESEVSVLTKEEAQEAINEIYARRGYIFRNEDIYNYFCRYDWYNPSIPADDFSDAVFSQIELDNIHLLAKYR